MNKVTFKKISKGAYEASTGEKIEFLTSSDWQIAGASGWYITELNGEFRGNRNETLRDAKLAIAIRYNKTGN